METKNLIIALGVVIIIGAGVFYAGHLRGGQTAVVVNAPSIVKTENMPATNAPVAAPAPAAASPLVSTSSNAVKEFTMTSYFEMTNGKPSTHFSLKDISVNKGDKVRIKVTNTKGNHDFTVDEYKIHEITPLNQEVTIEFTADKAGDFVYYCSMPNHRAMGQWGTLHVAK